MWPAGDREKSAISPRTDRAFRSSSLSTTYLRYRVSSATLIGRPGAELANAASVTQQDLKQHLTVFNHLAVGSMRSNNSAGVPGLHLARLSENINVTHDGIRLNERPVRN